MRHIDPVRLYYQTFYIHNRIRFLLAIILKIVLISGNLLVAWVLGSVIDIIAKGTFSELIPLLHFTMIAIPIFLLTTFIYHSVQVSFVERAIAQYKNLAFQHISKKSINTFSKENANRYVSLLTTDASTIEGNYLNPLFDLIAQPLILICSFIMMFWYSPLLTLFSALFCLLPLIGALLFGSKLSKQERIVSNKYEQFITKMSDLLTGFSVIKSFQAEREVSTIFFAENHSLEIAKRNRRWWQEILGEISGILGILLQFGIFFIGSVLALHGNITPGTLIIFVNLCGSLSGPLQSIPKLWALRKAAKGLINKLTTALAENTEHSGEPISANLSQAITFQNVSFSYETNKPILKNISLTLEQGKKYALVGASGSGKSTLLSLLMGSHYDYQGSLTVDGKEMRCIDPASLYNFISLIGQNVFLFNDTLHNNITMFQSFPEPQIEDAIKRSHLSSFVETHGANYSCGENGQYLSGGERQRVSIARSLLRKASVLLLDEATASLDNQTALSVMNAILSLDEVTCLIVTHSLTESSLSQYDEIFVLLNGEITERGDFFSLMKQKGYFYSLYRLAGD